MASYLPLPPPPQSTFGAPPPNQNPLPPPPAQSRGVNQYSQNWGGYDGGDVSSFPQSYPTQATFQYGNCGSSSLHSHYGGPPSNQVPLAVPPQQVLSPGYKWTEYKQGVDVCLLAIMKSFAVTASDNAKQDKFLAYMIPSLDELSKDMYDVHEDISFTWVREYHWDVRGEDADDPTTYLVAFGESEARYVPLPTKLILRKKRAKEGNSSDEIVPSRVTVRRSSKVSIIELKETRSYSGARASSSSSKHRRVDMEDSPARQRKFMQDTDIDQSSGAEYDLY